MLAYCLIILALAWKWDRPSYFDWTVSAYFLIVTVLLFIWPASTGTVIKRYAATGIYLCLFAASFLPPVLGFAPFTLQYARKYAPQSVWETPIFVTINRIMTFTWAGIFGVCILVSLYPSIVTQAVVPITIIIGVGVPFNIRFPNHYLKRLGLPPLSVTMAGTGSETVRTEAALSPGNRGSQPVRHEEPVRNIVYKETAMKVLALNSSPRGEGISKTGMLLDALVAGFSQAGAVVETVHLRKKKVNNCIGCYTCWTKTPGICIHKDDMTAELFPKWVEADVVVYATPLYHFTMNASMKAFIERTLPALEPSLINRDLKTTTHPWRHKPPASVVLSVAGFPELSVFDGLSRYVKFLLRDGLLAEIYRPAAETLNSPQFADMTKEILEATVQAGREIAESGKVSPATMQKITQPLGGDFESFAQMANLFWKTCIREGITPKEFHDRNMIPRPDSIDTFMKIMSLGFNPARAANTKAVIQFNFSGQIEGICHFEIDNGKINAKEGTAPKADLIVESPFETWMDVTTGKSDGRQLFMEQKCKASGDFSLLLRLKDLFGGSNRAD